MKQGWEIKKLGDVCDKASSNVSQNQLDNEDGEYPIFGASGFIKNVSFFHQKTPYLSIVKDGSGVGRVTKMDAFTSVIGTLQYLLPKENIDLSYLYYNLISIDFKKYVAGAAIPHIYFKDYANEPFLWMPIPEQQRIVTILDECFAAISKAKANAEQNLKNAKGLFESYLQSIFENKGEGWEEKQLGKVCDLFNGGTPDTKVNEYWNGDNLWITPKDMGKLDSIFVDDTERKITNDGLRNSSAKILPVNSVILSSRAPIGHLAINTKPISTNQGCKGLVPKKDLETLFLFYFLKKSIALLNELGSGTTFKELSGSKLSDVLIPMPKNVIEQQTIVQKLDLLSAETKKLEAIYQKKIDDLEELKKSILQKAFAGELTTKEIAV